MSWNWQLKGWPNFSYNQERIRQYEQEFLHKAGVIFGIYKHLNTNDETNFKVALITNEALSTSEIEGEFLDRQSVQSSVQRCFKLKPITNLYIKPREQGITELMFELYQTHQIPLSHTVLYGWHKKLLKYRHDLEFIGCYRNTNEPMQIISGPIGNPKIHFEAPPATQVKIEMDTFLKWFNRSGPNTEQMLEPIIRSAITLYILKASILLKMETVGLAEPYQKKRWLNTSDDLLSFH